MATENRSLLSGLQYVQYLTMYGYCRKIVMLRDTYGCRSLFK